MIGVESPCISVCRMDQESNLCIGCWRTEQEISDWLSFDSKERLKVIDQLHLRRIAAGGRKRRSTSRRNKS